MLIEINKVKVNERIRKDFGDIQELAEDIKTNGLINPPVVTPDYELIAGERRLRALKELGYNQIEVRIMTVNDALHQLKLEISENENRKDFSFNEKMTWAKMLEVEYGKIAKENQLSGLKNQESSFDKFLENDKINTNKQVAEEVGFGNKETYRQAKYISENADEETIKKLDDGQLSINKAYTQLKEKLSEKENQIAGYELKLKTLENKPPKIIDNTDYNTIETLKKQIINKEKDIDILKRDKDLLERKVKLNDSEAKQFGELKKQIEFLTKEKSDIARQITSATELSGLVVRINNMLKTELSPIRYSRTLERLDSDVAIKNLEDIINSVQSWVDDMKKVINKDYIILEEK